MYSQIFQIRKRSQVPFYCDPVKLFLAVWVLMLLSLYFPIAYTTYPDASLGLILFIASLLSYVLGYVTVRAAHKSVGYEAIGPDRYRIDVTRVRRFHGLLWLVVIAIVVLNLKIYGMPPVLGFFGVQTLNYGEYGSLKQALFPAIMVLFVSAALEPSWMRRWTIYLFCPACIFAYASRGPLLIMLFQGLIVFSLRTSLSKKKLYAIAAFTLGFALLVSDTIGNNRSSQGAQGLLLYMQVKRAYYDWPTALLWIISYVQTPISNLCWIVRVYPYDHPSGRFLSTLLPGSWAQLPLEGGDLGSANIVDGVHTYIAKYYLDFWLFGIFIINYIWGLVSAHMSAGNRLMRNYLSSAVLLGCIGFIFFVDYLSVLAILVELSLLAIGQRYVTVGCET
jgi:hypothetical protein